MVQGSTGGILGGADYHSEVHGILTLLSGTWCRTATPFRHHGGDVHGASTLRNTKVEKEASQKHKSRYLGPMRVVRRTTGGAYILAELDGAESKTRYAAFRVIPYYARDGDTRVMRDDDAIDIGSGDQDGSVVGDVGDGNSAVEEDTFTDDEDNFLL